MGASKKPSGAEVKRRAAAKKAPGPLIPDLAEPPTDPALLVLWGAEAAAKAAHRVAVADTTVDAPRLRLFKDFLATLGMLFPRSEIVERLKKLTQKQKRQKDEKEVQPLDGLAPGPASRRRRAGG